MKLLITENYGEENLNRLIELGYEVVYQNERKIENNEKFDDADILIGYDPFSNLDISKMKNLKYIQLTSVGFNHIPKEKIKNQNILIANYKGGFNIPIAEWIVMNILNSYKNTFELYEKQKEKIWKPEYKIEEIYEKTVGFIGTGNIAIEAAKRLQSFGINVFGVNTDGRDVNYFDKSFSLNEIDYVLKISDVVVLALPGTEKNKNFINEEKINMMKENAVLINISRGSVLDEKALIQNIEKFKKVFLDVTKEEPLPVGNELWNFDNIIITPHNSWISKKNKQRTFDMIYENLRRYINKEEILNKIDIDRGY